MIIFDSLTGASLISRYVPARSVMLSKSSDDAGRGAGVSVARGVGVAEGVTIARGVGVAEGVTIARGVGAAEGVTVARGVGVAWAGEFDEDIDKYITPPIPN